MQRTPPPDYQRGQIAGITPLNSNFFECYAEDPHTCFGSFGQTFAAFNKDQPIDSIEFVSSWRYAWRSAASDAVFGTIAGRFFKNI
jgi:hypothetical protein